MAKNSCGEVDRMMSEGWSVRAIREQADEHILHCDRCGPLMQFYEAPLSLPEPAANATSVAGDRISFALQFGLEAAPPLPGAAKIVGAVLGTAAGVWMLWMLLMGLPGYSQMDPMRRMALVVYSLVLIVLLAGALGRLMRPTAPKPIAPVVLVLGLLAGYPLLVAFLYPRVPQRGALAEGVVCFLLGLISSMLAGAVIWRVSRRGYVRNSWLSGAVVGALGGLTGVLVLQAVCPESEAGHMIIWHGLSAGLSVLGGVIAGYLAQRRR